jgi:hypothetical protein
MMHARAVFGIICGLAMTAMPLALQPKADAPSVDLTNGVLKAKMYLPDVKRGYYRSTRFEWGVLASLEFKGHSFYGPWFSKHDPAVGNFEFRSGEVVVGDHNWISGPVEEYSVPLGYDDAKPGGTFIKIGVGHLRKPADGAAYRFSNFYDVVDPGTWTSKTSATSAEMMHTVKDSGGGYGYDYTKVTRLVPGAAQMVIEHRIRNTGSKPFESSTYNHNFMVMDGHPTGPGLVFIAPFALTTARPPDPAFAEITGNRFVYKKELQVGDQVAGRLQGYGASAADYDFRIENARAGTGVRIRGDRPLSSMVLWSIRPTFAIEPFVTIAAKPGEQFTWTYTYDYYELAK